MKSFIQNVLFYLLFSGTFSASEIVSFSQNEINTIKTLSPIPEIPADPTNQVSLSPKAVDLGMELFNDWRLSRGEEFACQTCHRTTDDFMSVRLDTPKDIPSLWNIAYNNWFFWDGRADTLWMQALGPIENPDEHDFSRSEIAKLIQADDDYKKTYVELFGNLPDFSDDHKFPIPAMPSKQNHEADKNWKSMSQENQMKVNRVFANVGKVLAAFQMSLVSQKTNFDVFVEGLKESDIKKINALSLEAQRGLKVFIGKGKCIDCHNGPTFTDSKFHNTLLPETGVELGFNQGRYGGINEVKKSIFNAAGPFSDAPKGQVAQRLKVLKTQDTTKNGFKTPGLRNISYTYPYMHSGQFSSLSDVIEFYSEMKHAQKSDRPEIEPRKFTKQEKSDLLAFLNSLSSYYRKQES